MRSGGKAYRVRGERTHACQESAGKDTLVPTLSQCERSAGGSMRALPLALTLLALTSQSATTHACRYGRHPSCPACCPDLARVWLRGGVRSHGACVLSAERDGCARMADVRVPTDLGIRRKFCIRWPESLTYQNPNLLSHLLRGGASGCCPPRTRRGGWRASIVDTRASAAAGVPGWCDPLLRPLACPSEGGASLPAPHVTNAASLWCTRSCPARRARRSWTRWRAARRSGHYSPRLRRPWAVPTPRRLTCATSARRW